MNTRGEPGVNREPGTEGVRIGLFGGTFDPVHYGHLRAAEEIQERLGLTRVIFIPAAIPPHKADGAVASGPHRLAMVRHAVTPNPTFEVSDVEIRRPGKSYSIETIRHFQETFGDEVSLYFAMGIDAFLEIATWKSVDEIFSTCHFVVMTRPGYALKDLEEIVPLDLAKQFCYDQNGGGWLHESGYSIRPCEISLLDISATSIRNRIGETRSVRFLAPEKVLAYIDEHRLYRSEAP